MRYLIWRPDRSTLYYGIIDFPRLPESLIYYSVALCIRIRELSRNFGSRDSDREPSSYLAYQVFSAMRTLHAALKTEDGRRVSV